MAESGGDIRCLHDNLYPDLLVFLISEKLDLGVFTHSGGIGTQNNRIHRRQRRKGLDAARRPS